MKVSEIMARDVVSVGRDEPVSCAARLMERYNIGAVPVSGEDGRIVGVVTDRDIITRCVALGERPAQTPVKRIMTKKAVTVNAGDDVRRAAQLMAARRVRRLPVVEDDRVVGMVSLGDIAALGHFDMEASLALSEISSNIRRL